MNVIKHSFMFGSMNILQISDIGVYERVTYLCTERCDKIILVHITIKISIVDMI